MTKYNYYKLSAKRTKWQLKVCLYMIAIAFLCGVIFGIERGIEVVEPVEAQEYVRTIVEAKSEATDYLGVSVVTMYTSRPEETDASPCIGANGQDVCVLWRNGQNICATNWADLGSVIRIDGLGECLVLDRMNSRYHTEVDFYAGFDNECLDGYDKGDNCPQLQKALSFGSQKKDIWLLE